MIKLISLLITTFPIMVFGLYYSNKDIYRQKDLRELYKGLNILKNEIDYSFKTLPQCFLSISRKTNYPINEIFYTLSKDLEIESDYSFEEIFKNSLHSTINKTYLNKNDFKEFLDLSSTINHLDNTAILSSINIFLVYLKTEIDNLENIKSKNKKTYQSLTILTSILLIIILL